MEELRKKLDDILEKLEFIERQNQKIMEVQAKSVRPCGGARPAQGNADAMAPLLSVLKRLGGISKNPEMNKMIDEVEEAVKKVGDGTR